MRMYSSRTAKHEALLVLSFVEVWQITTSILHSSTECQSVCDQMPMQAQACLSALKDMVGDVESLQLPSFS